MIDEHIRAQMIALLPRLRRFARGLTGTADQADDLVQAACERALTRIAQYTPGTRLDSWMFRIVQTIWLDERRAAKVRTGQGQVDAAAAEPELTVDGVRRMEAHLTFDAVRRAMAKLPDEQRAVMALVCIDGQTYKEAAETLSIPIGTVMSRLARARLALARELAEGGEGGTNIVRLG
ncbi:MAG TPA: RNA polymerase sigma factor [Alphaproteobacteria bacterium]|nr:RNA polymerase sigma factor [Alphaproteobacteria bacterium]